MNEIIRKLTKFLRPAGSSALGHALVGLAILIIGLLVLTFIVGIFNRMLTKVSTLHRTSTDGSVTDLASPIASLFKVVLTIFVLMAVLEHFGLWLPKTSNLLTSLPVLPSLFYTLSGSVSQDCHRIGLLVGTTTSKRPARNFCPTTRNCR